VAEWISTTEAARRSGLSKTQIRRRIDAGQLHSRIEERPQGKRILVEWDMTGTSPKEPVTSPDVPDQETRDAPGDVPHVTDAPSPDLHTQHLEEEIAWLRDRLEAAERGQEQLRQLLAMEQSTVLQLRQSLPAPVDQNEPVTSPTSRTSWWAFWRRPASEPSPT
jgi:hypothetical protein